MTSPRRPSAEIVSQAWIDAPDWVQALAARIDAVQSQRRAAKEIGYSVGAVNGVLNANYKGNLQKVEAAVRRTIMVSKVECPVLSEITRAECKANQARPFSATSGQSMQLYRACRTCLQAVCDQGGGRE